VSAFDRLHIKADRLLPAPTLPFNVAVPNGTNGVESCLSVQRANNGEQTSSHERTTLWAGHISFVQFCGLQEPDLALEASCHCAAGHGWKLVTTYPNLGG
jgi:hypothetical protein